ncbi:MAG TPA: thioredoxin family protein [Dokdonella sp.]|uniref:thioredoxin family protein n=1 Tax=Dokdonella sp. TaxID=2291710 RepID=UPI002D7FAFD1|nr:thioredoxin family protein [Dokdonella sp.]HET9033165.1 thioredoxin family protein [Dokdonella sp.]
MSTATTTEFLLAFPVREVTSTNLDDELARSPARLDILFLWGRDCVNCDIAKASILAASERFQWPDVRWLHANVYADPEMATRFGLHGIPVFFVFRQGKKLGRITEWPGADAFVDAIERLRGVDDGEG